MRTEWRCLFFWLMKDSKCEFAKNDDMHSFIPSIVFWFWKKKIAKTRHALLFCSQNHRQKLPRTDEQLADASWNCCSLRHTSHFFHSMIFSCRSFCEAYCWKQIDKIRDTKQLKIKPHGRILPCRTSFFSNIYHVWMIVLFMENDIERVQKKEGASFSPITS